MKCFYHEDREAVATCQHCGKALCRACASLYTPCLCVDCAQLLRDQQAEQARAERRTAAENIWTRLWIPARNSSARACTARSQL